MEDVRVYVGENGLAPFAMRAGSDMYEGEMLGANARAIVARGERRGSCPLEAYEIAVDDKFFFQADRPQEKDGEE